MVRGISQKYEIWSMCESPKIYKCFLQNCLESKMYIGFGPIILRSID